MTLPSRRTGLVALKRGMLSYFDPHGRLLPATVLQIDQCQVIAHKLPAIHNRTALEIGAVPAKTKHIGRAREGQFRANGVPPKRKTVEFQVEEEMMVPVGTELTCQHFVPGQYVDVKGTSIGKGFAGVMKRWGFSGQPASHGASLSHRSAGSTGQNSDPSRVFPGKKMAGRLGNRNCTEQNLQVLRVDPSLNLIYVKGGVPGHDNNYVLIRDAVKKPLQFTKGKLSTPPPMPTFIPSPGQKSMFMPAIDIPKTATNPISE